MTSEHPLARIVGELDRAGIPHMLVGSFASTFHRDPRTARDIDLVIDPERVALDQLVRQLGPDTYHVSAEAVDEAWRRRGQLDVVILESGWRVDLTLRKHRRFSAEEFSRRMPAEITGAHVFVATAEDTIVAKLDWARAGESERQLRDVSGILEVRAGELDIPYIEHWVAELGLGEHWSRAKAQVIPE